MLPVHIEIDGLIIRNLAEADIQEALECINQDTESYTTLGLTELLKYEELEQRYLESLMNSLEYFCGIFREDKLIGILKGRIENKQENELWILSFLILKEYRSQGIGTRILQALERFFQAECKINRFCIIILGSNERGLGFWLGNQYAITRKTNSIGMTKSNEMLILDKLLR